MPPVVGALIAAGVTAGATFGTQVAIGAGIVVATKAAVAAFGVSLLASLTAGRGDKIANDTTQVVRSSNLPARWIVGRARVGGQLVFYNEVNQDNYQGSTPKPHAVNLALILSEGALDSIEKIWINGEEVNIESRTSDRDGVHLNLEEKWSGNLAVWEYFAADGTGGASLREEATVNTFNENLQAETRHLWTDQHKLTGKSWVHVKLIQNDYGGDTEARLWDRFPEINFLVKGIKITWPGQTTPTWTESAAAIRYWWLTERCKISPDVIDLESFYTAEFVCNERVTYPVGDDYEGYEPESSRYSINGVITSEDDPDSLNQEFDFCWQGYVVEADSKLYFRPGVDRPISRTLVEKDIISVDQIRTAPILQERINAMSMSISQSKAKAYQPQDCPRQQDLVITESRDNGQQLWTNIGTRRFINDPLAAARLLRIALRRVQSLSSYTYTVKPGQQLQWLSVTPADWIRVENPSLGIEGVMFVVGVVTNPNWSVTITLQPQAANVYSGVPTGNVLPNPPSPVESPRVETYHSDVHSDHGDINESHTNVHTNVNHTNLHTDIPTQHGDHTDIPQGTHSDTHSDLHTDRPNIHSNVHNDLPGAASHVNAHNDHSHSDDHDDRLGTHNDTHTDNPQTVHVNAHNDHSHSDDHDDRLGTHNDTHTDNPQTVHVDAHNDHSHSDDHDDRPGVHGDNHLDQEADEMNGIPHDDIHNDEETINHGNTHNDGGHVDQHTNIQPGGHGDNHEDQGPGLHADTHYDRPGDFESGTPHDDLHDDAFNVNHGNTHNDGGHVDIHTNIQPGQHLDYHGDSPGSGAESHTDNHSNITTSPGVGTHTNTYSGTHTNTHGDNNHVDLHNDRTTGNLVHINVHQDHTDQLTQLRHSDHVDGMLDHQDHSDIFPVPRLGDVTTDANNQGMTLPMSLGGRRNSRISSTEWVEIPYAVIVKIDGNVYRTVSYQFNGRTVGVMGEIRLFNKDSQLPIGSALAIDSMDPLPFVHPSVDTLVNISNYVLQARVKTTPTRRQGMYIWGSQVNPGN